MAAKKSSSGQSPFKSLRIIGEKAQKLLQRARELHSKNSRDAAQPTAVLPGEKALPVVTVHISLRGAVRSTFAILAILACVAFLYLITDKIVLLLLAIFVATLVDPGVQMMQRFRIPRGVAVLVHYFVALFFLIFLFISLIPIIADQIQQIALYTSRQVDMFLTNPNVDLPFLTDEMNLRLTALFTNGLQSLSIHQFTDALQAFSNDLATTAQGSLLFAAQIAGSVVAFFINLVLILVMAFFMQLEKEKIIAWLRGFLPWGYRSYVHDKSEAIQWRLSQWIRGQLLLCFSVGFMVFLALKILRVDYALTLGILAGFTEFIPVVGPLIAAVPAVLIAFTTDGLIRAMAIIAVYYIIQWCENNLLVPLIMRRTVGLSPIAIMFSMLAGISFPNIIHPVLGVILAIPFTTIVALFLEDWRSFRRTTDSRHLAKEEM